MASVTEIKVHIAFQQQGPNIPLDLDDIELSMSAGGDVGSLVERGASAPLACAPHPRARTELLRRARHTNLGTCSDGHGGDGRRSG